MMLQSFPAYVKINLCYLFSQRILLNSLVFSSAYRNYVVLGNKQFVFVNKELQRVNKDVMASLEQKDIITVFPEQSVYNKTVLVMKTPKTATSVRKVFLPKTVAEMLVAWKMEQDLVIEALGGKYANYNLVIASPMGTPTEASKIRKSMKELIEKNNLPPVVFHSLRHSSITYKLKLTGGDIKAVQGDSSHAQAQMVTDQYSHILDDSRRSHAELFEKAFYDGCGSEPTRLPVETKEQLSGQAAGIDSAVLSKLLSKPEMANMLMMLAQSMGS